MSLFAWEICAVVSHLVQGGQAFNAQFDDFLKRKAGALGRIEERSSRVAEIARELGVADEPLGLAGRPSEDPIKALEVQDHEVKVEKWVSAEERRRAAEEEARRLAAQAQGGDDAGERALKQMMGGTLEGESRVGKLEEYIPKPAHLDNRPRDELNEAEVKELVEWEKACKALEEEQMVYRKALEGEAKKLRGESMEEARRVDEFLAELSDARLKADYQVLHLEIHAVCLAYAISQEEADAEESITLQKQMAELEHRANAAREAAEETDNITAAKDTHLEDKRRAARDREKGVRRDIAEALGSKEASEALMRAYKRRVVSEARSAIEGAGSGEDLVKRAAEAVREAMRDDAELAALESSLQILRSERDRLQAAVSEAAARYEDAQRAVQAAGVRRETAGLDLDVPLRLKQGQVELPSGDGLEGTHDGAALVDREAIGKLNRVIRSRGAEKSGVLRETKELRRGIQSLEWEEERLTMQEEDLVKRLKDLQLLRVTKNIQSSIKGGDEDKAAREAATLERQLAHATAGHTARVAERSKAAEALRGQTSATRRENTDLDQDILALESAVVERQRLVDLQGGGLQGRARRGAGVQAVVTQRKLLDLARAQTREIELMREELVRLRARTFPTFAQLSASIDPIPDALG